MCPFLSLSDCRRRRGGGAGRRPNYKQKHCPSIFGVYSSHLTGYLHRVYYHSEEKKEKGRENRGRYETIRTRNHMPVNVHFEKEEKHDVILNLTFIVLISKLLF